jgi:hypothetical protein
MDDSAGKHVDRNRRDELVEIAARPGPQYESPVLPLNDSRVAFGPGSMAHVVLALEEE